MQSEVADSFIDSIPKPLAIRERMESLRREQEVLARLLRVSEFASERLPSNRTNEQDALPMRGRS